MGKRIPVTYHSRQRLETKATVNAIILEMLVDDGYSIKQISEELGMNVFHVKHVISEAEKKGKIHSTWWSWYWGPKKK